MEHRQSHASSIMEDLRAWLNGYFCTNTPKSDICPPPRISRTLATLHHVLLQLSHLILRPSLTVFRRLIRIICEAPRILAAMTANSPIPNNDNLVAFCTLATNALHDTCWHDICESRETFSKHPFCSQTVALEFSHAQLAKWNG